ncbi:MAG: heme lyase CcmF/NrfE family subunit [Steroidobacteraceae bacterium]
MSVELGHFALILAFALALVQAFFGLAGAITKREHWMAAARSAVAGQFVFVLFSFACLTAAFLRNDFSVLYVAANSNTELPMFYRVAAVWGAHEGSLLLWLLILVVWSAAVAVFNRAMTTAFISRVLGVLGLISGGFSLFIIATSNPFERLLPAAMQGRDLNPLLQDPALAAHPPLLYTGYVGLAVPFACAVAALMEGKLDSAWARWVRPWTTLSWLFLTLGIALGSFWAYYELGWGGWWFWDPVENASFMPWLMGTALIHSLAVTEKRGLFKSWTALLAIFGFSLSLLGTFLVRSGVLVSVHAFASDPSRGLFILIFLALCIGGALTLYAWRAPRLQSNAGFAVVSRESFLLFNNVLLVVAAGLILLGTLYPLFVDALNLGKISVGPPYFSVVFLIPMLPLVLLLAVGMHAGWKHAKLITVRKPILLALAAAALFAAVVNLWIFGRFSPLCFVGLMAGAWVILSALIDPVSRLRAGHSLSPGILAMSLAHIGLGVFVLGATTVETYKIEKDLSLANGQGTQIAGYEFTLLQTRAVPGPNYDAIEGTVRITRDGQEVAVLHPQKRVYRVQTMPMTEAGIDAHWRRDLFVALGEDLGNGVWSLRIQYKPLVRFIWLGAVIMAIGGFIGVLDRRYRVKATSNATVADTATARV